MSATIRDIAKQLNISVSTVSYALNGGPRPVPERVRAQVLAAARDLNYRPNRNARSLITKRAQSIGVVPSELGYDFSLSPYFHFALNGIINVAEALHQDVLVFTREDQRNAEKLMNYLLDGRVDGLIFVAPPINSPTVRLVHQSGLPYIVLGNGQDEDAVGYDIDNSRGVTEALEHLFNMGHRRIGHISGRPSHHDSISREAAFRDFHKRNGLVLREEHIISGDFTALGGQEAGRQLLKQPDRPTAVFCANDESAMGLMQVARELGVSVPKDLSVVGFDDSPLGVHLFPPLTTIRQPVSQMASEAIQDLVHAIEGKSTLRSRSFPPNIVVRDSTACPQEDILYS